MSHRLLIYLITLCITYISCNKSSHNDTVRVFHYNQHNNITSLDPAFAKSQNNIWAVNHIFNTLVQLDDQLNIVPGIAKSWTVDSTGLNYTFILRSDVWFHTDDCFGAIQKRKVDANDIVYSYNRLMDRALNAPGSWIFKDKMDVESAFTILNDTVLTISLLKPFSPFLSLLTMQYCSIVPHEAIDYYKNDFFRHPVGSGPFKFKRWAENQGLFLVRNQDYFEWQTGEAESNIDAVRTSFIGERSIAFLELVNGRIDLFSGLESGYVNTALTADGDLRPEYKGVQFIKSPFLNFEYLGFNPKAPGAHKLLKEKAFRQALNYAIDRQLMLTSLRNNVGQPAHAGVITHGLPSHDPDKVRGYSYQPDKAAQLIAQYHKEDLAEPLTIFTSKDYLDLTTYIAKQWEYLGLNINIEVMESAALRDAMRNGQIPVFRASWIADYPDGESFLSMFYSQNPAPPNYTLFKNETFDNLYLEALKSTDETHKNELYQTMDRLLIEEAPVAFLFYDEIALFADARLSGLSKNALNLLQVKYIHKADLIKSE